MRLPVTAASTSSTAAVAEAKTTSGGVRGGGGGRRFLGRVPVSVPGAAAVAAGSVGRELADVPDDSRDRPSSRLQSRAPISNGGKEFPRSPSHVRNDVVEGRKAESVEGKTASIEISAPRSQGFQTASQYMEQLSQTSTMSSSEVVDCSVLKTSCPKVLAGKSNNMTASTSSCSLNSQERLELKNWGLPDLIRMRYERKGISTMFPWQADCLGLGKVLQGGNLVYSAPTSAGKTLVAELLLIKRVLETKKKGIFILPFVSLAREKMFGLQDLLRDVHIRVFGFMGSQAPPGGMSRTDIAVCTIEKANSIVNRLLEEGCLSDLGAVVVDELHLLGDPSRGYLLELLLTKIRYMSFKEANCDIQVIGMSATLPNLNLLADWLDADLYKTDFRPVPLTENIKVGTKIYNSQFELVRQLKPIVELQGDTDHLIYLCLETLLDGHSVLVFCPTKNWCEKLATSVASEFSRLGSSKAFRVPETVTKRLRQELQGSQLSEIIDQLRRCPAGLDESLSKVISFGVAYHHAGLTFDERDIIEGAFKSGVLRVLISTSTLSSGVNLPARRVIVRCPFTFQNQLIDTLSYKQMVGRAGRKGVDTEGESILLCRENERLKVAELVSSPLQPVSSCLVQGTGGNIGSAMKRAILEVVSSGAATTRAEIEKYASCTMLAASLSQGDKETDDYITNCVQFLEANEFIRLQNVSAEEVGAPNCTRYVPSQLGLACLASSLSPDEGLQVFVELQKARKCFVLENELHIVYQVVPIYAAVSWPNLDWMHYLSIWESLSTDMKRVGDMVGVEERFLVRAMRGTIAKDTQKQARTLAVHQRFYTALALHDLVNEVHLKVVSEKYGATKGMLQSLQQSASTFAGMVTVFCHKLGWLNLELLLGQFQDRLQFGVQRELIDLCRLSTLNGQRARILYAAKMESVVILANSRESEVENVLVNAAPFESHKQGDGETEREASRRQEVRSFWVTGLKGLTFKEAAKAIVEEAREILQKDLGMKIDFSSQEGREKSKSLTGSTNAINGKHKERFKGGRQKKANNSGRRKSASKQESSSSRLLSFYRNTKPAIATDKNLVLESMKRRSSDIESKPAKHSKNSCEQKSPRGFCSTPLASRATRTSLGPETSPAVAKADLTFDMSCQLDEIFENEGDDFFQEEQCKPEAAKFVSPKGKVRDDSHSGDEDLFGNSLADFSAMDSMLHKYDDSKPADFKDKADNSCPRTPNLLVCNSEELILQISNGNSAVKTSPSGRVVAAVLRSPILPLDTTLSDSFLERAMNTHMSQDDDTSIPAKVNVAAGPTVINAVRHTFLVPSPPVARDPSDTPKADKSSRLSKRRQNQRVMNQKKISPGLLILSDSDSFENFSDSTTSPLNEFNRSSFQAPASSLKEGPSQSEELQIIDVCSRREVWLSFVAEWRSKPSFSIALACEQSVGKMHDVVKQGIGARVMKRKCASKDSNKKSASDELPGEEELPLQEFGMVAVGMAVSWDKLDAFYISFATSKSEADLDDSLAAPTQDTTISLDEKLLTLRSVLESDNSPKTIIIFDSKEHYKHIYLSLGLIISHHHTVLDLKVALWMLQPMDKEKNLANIVMNYEQSLMGLLPTLGSTSGCGSVALNGNSGQSTGRLRSVAESVISRRVMERIEKDLSDTGMWNPFKDVEMRSMLTLARMELNGVGFSAEESERQRKIITARMDELEVDAYRLAGHEFALTSVEDICQILYKELKLPINGDPTLSHKPSVRVVQGRSKGARSNPSTTKDVLIKLKAFHELPGVILEWRKLNVSISKVVFPLQKAKIAHSALNMDRIYPTCQTQTATGRISIHEPNIQGIPRDFDIAVTQSLKEKALGRRESKLLGSSRSTSSDVSFLSSFLKEDDAPVDERYLVSMRHAIVPTEGFLILAADYSQLELRILAHLSDDANLKKILNDGKDVFVAIAASWKRIAVEMVTDVERQQAKQICYGMVYGIGTKSLGEQLGVVEEEASVFLSDFKSAYPGVKRFMDETLTKCRSCGFVETMHGRRRYLPKITSGASHFVRSAAERQAVNTAVQGSAADLVKTAMNDIDRQISEAFPSCKQPLRISNRNPQKCFKTEGAYFVLQMHDELLYEVARDDAIRVAQIVKTAMENSCQLSVQTPVKVKIGTSWGQILEMKDL